MFVRVHVGVCLGFKVLYVQEVDTVIPVQYMPTPQNLPRLSTVSNPKHFKLSNKCSLDCRAVSLVIAYHLIVNGICLMCFGEE